jgi:segregation and condensation protein A
MLLPADEAPDEDEDGPDPREELVRRLLEYKQFKEAASQLDGRERLRRDMFAREVGPPPDMQADEALLDDVTLFHLVDVLQDILARHPGKQLVEILPDNMTVRDRMNAILEALEGHEAVDFASLFESVSQRMLLIVTFLALLELIRIRVVRVFQGEAFGAILVSRAFSAVGDIDPAEDMEWRDL